MPPTKLEPAVPGSEQPQDPRISPRGHRDGLKNFYFPLFVKT